MPAASHPSGIIGPTQFIVKHDFEVDILPALKGGVLVLSLP